MELILDKTEIAAYKARRKHEAENENDSLWYIWGFIFVCVVIVSAI